MDFRSAGNGTLHTQEGYFDPTRKKRDRQTEGGTSGEGFEFFILDFMSSPCSKTILNLNLAHLFKRAF